MTTTTGNDDHHVGVENTNNLVSSEDRSSSTTKHVKLSFKNSKFTKHGNTSRKRTWKNLKQILALESTSNLPVSVATCKSIFSFRSTHLMHSTTLITGRQEHRSTAIPLSQEEVLRSDWLCGKPHSLFA